MIRRTLILYQISFLMIVLSLPLLVIGQSSSDAEVSFIDQLTNEMSVKQQLSEAPEDIRAQFAANPLQLPAEKNERMLASYKEAYDSELLLEDFKAAFQQSMSDKYKNEISQWLNEPSTQTVTGAREEFYTLQGKRKRVIAMHEMDQKPASEERKEIISKLANASTIAESSVESSVIILRSVIEALNRLSEKRNFSDAQVNAIANNFRTQMQSQASQQLNNRLSLMYYDLENGPLENYIGFWETDTGQWLDKTTNESMQSAYRSAADRFLNSINNDSASSAMSTSN